MFSGGVYVGEHTSQAASVGSVRSWRIDPARSGLLSPLVGKGFAFFDKLSAPSRKPAGGAAFVRLFNSPRRPQALQVFDQPFRHHPVTAQGLEVQGHVGQLL